MINSLSPRSEPVTGSGGNAPSPRHDNDGLRKLCACPRRKWPKCDHPWYLNFSHRGVSYRYSLDTLLSPRRVRAKTEAVAAAEQLRAAIRNGTFRKPGAPDAGPVLARLTLAQLLALYDTRYLSVERAPKNLRNDRYLVAAIGRVPLPLPTGDAARAFGDWCVTDITAGTLEDYRAVRRAAGATVGCNRSLALLRAAFNWAIRMGYVERTPFMRGTQAVVKLSRELPRRRRLEPGEADRLLAACRTPHLRGLVEAALETGCRGGELLSLQWHQVRADPRPELVMMASKTKNRRDRRIPISTRLAPVLAMRRSGPDGRPHPPTAYVFGNEVGQRVTSVRRIWQAAVLRAHGHRPTYNPHTRTLTPDCRALLQTINLHFHDLRREAGSRWLDGGVPLSTIRDWLGHANIAQTGTYLESTCAGQHDAMRAFEARQAALQVFASADATGHHTTAFTGTDANRNAPEHTGKLH